MAGDFSERISDLQEEVGSGHLAGMLNVDQVYRPKPARIISTSAWT